jgi:hypothetical protein
MRTFVHRPKAVETTGFALLRLAQNRGAHFRTVERRVDSIIPGSTRVSYDFSQIPLYPPARTSIQPKLKLSAPGDQSEQEADRVAEQVVPMSAPSRESVTANGGAPGIVPPIAQEVIRAPGRSLDPPIRAFMEARFGYDFGRVRIHTEPAAAAAAEAINANAYSFGNHVLFDRGQYDPASDRGKRLLAHELAHVTQQRSAASPVVARQPAQKPAPPQTQGQASSAAQNECSKLNWSALQLPRTNKNRGAEFFEATVMGIRFLGGVSAKQAGKVKSNVKAVAAEIDKLNRLIADPASKVNIVIVTEGSEGEFRLLCNQPVLIIDPDQFTAETGAHETTHGVTHFLVQQSGTAGVQSSGAKNFLEKMADIFLQLQSLTIELGPGNTVEATNLVDPQTLDPKAKPEHPQDDVDEFISSSVAVFLVSRAALERKIKEFGKTNPKITAIGMQLINLLNDVVGKQALPAKPLPVTSGRKEIAAEIHRIKPTPVDEGVFGTHALLTELLFPPKTTP